MPKDLDVPGLGKAQFRAVMARAQLDQDVARGRVVGEEAGMDALRPAGLEGVGDKPVHRLGGVAETPEGFAQPIADFIALGRIEAGRAEKDAVLAALDDVDLFLAGLTRQEVLGILLAVRMRYA